MKTKTVTGKKVKETNLEDAQRLMLTVARANTRIKHIEAAIEAEQNGIVEAYLPEISQLLETVKAAEQELELYAEKNKDTWPKDKKQLALKMGVIGFKTSPHRIELPEGKNPDEIVEVVNTLFPDYTTTTTVVELNKQLIISDRNSEVVSELLKETGITIEQDENFYCKPVSQNIRTATAKKKKAEPVEAAA